jgi:Protein of unknown function (DUF3618)
MSDDRTNEADAIEQDVRQTQDEMGETLQKLEDQLTPKGIAQSVMGDQGTDQARELLDLVKQNPIPVGLIAIGAIWLLATARSPIVDRLKKSVSSRSDEFNLRPRSEEPAPIGPPPETGTEFDRRSSDTMAGRSSDF